MSTSAFSKLVPQAQAISRAIANVAYAHPFTTGTTILALGWLRSAITDYRAWCAIGAGGVRQDPIGYLMARVFGLWASGDLYSTHVYDAAAARSLKYLPSDLPVRQGSRPPVSQWAFPIRQLAARSSRKLVAELGDAQTRVMEGSAGTARKASSRLEGGHSPALFVDSVADFEVYHVHNFDGSAHAVLAPGDAQLLLDNGWGERHPLSGRMPGKKYQKAIPLTYVMVYAPRNSEEVKVHEMVAKAAIAFAVGGRE